NQLSVRARNITSDGRGYHPASDVGGVARLCSGNQHTYCMRRLWANIKAAVKSFGQHKVPRLAAALAYYTLFSLAPLLVIIIAVVGSVFGTEEARTRLVAQIQGFVGPDIANLISDMIAQTQ